MKKFLKILFLPILAINLALAIGLVCCAYSPLLPAEQVPLLSLAGLAFPFVLAANFFFLVLWVLIYPRYVVVPVVTGLICFAQIRAYIPININRQNPPKNSVKVLSYNILSSNII